MRQSRCLYVVGLHARAAATLGFMLSWNLTNLIGGYSFGRISLADLVVMMLIQMRHAVRELESYLEDE
jgi:hypothetical protein